MLYKLASSVYVNLSEIKSVSMPDSGRSDYPYRLTVEFKDGGAKSIDYKWKNSRDDDAAALSYNQEKECPVSRFEVEQIVTREVDKMRRDFRRLRESLKEAKE